MAAHASTDCRPRTLALPGNEVEGGKEQIKEKYAKFQRNAVLREPWPGELAAVPHGRGSFFMLAPSLGKRGVLQPEIKLHESAGLTPANPGHGNKEYDDGDQIE